MPKISKRNSIRSRRQKLRATQKYREFRPICAPKEGSNEMPQFSWKLFRLKNCPAKFTQKLSIIRDSKGVLYKMLAIFDKNFVRQMKCRNFRRNFSARIACLQKITQNLVIILDKCASYTKYPSTFGQKSLHWLKCRNFRQNFCIKNAGPKNIRKNSAKFWMKNAFYKKSSGGLR